MMVIRYCIMAVIMVLPLNFLYAQGKVDSTMQKVETEEVKVDLETLLNLKSDQKRLSSTQQALDATEASLKAAQGQIDSLKRTSQQMSLQLQSAQRDNERLKQELDAIKAKPIAMDKHLISMAANFLFIPYEAYSVDSIAIKAFDFVQSRELRQQYADRREVLVNYRQDVESLLKLLSSPNFGKNKLVAERSLKELKASPVYQRYHTYQWLDGSYLYDKISIVEKRLTSILNQNGAPYDYKNIIEELAKCLQTINLE